MKLIKRQLTEHSSHPLSFSLFAVTFPIEKSSFENEFPVFYSTNNKDLFRRLALPCTHTVIIPKMQTKF